MKIANQFTVNVPIEKAWAVLTDLEMIAPCMPGAQLTGVDDDVYSGKVKVKVGPVTAEYAGTARFIEKDDASYRAVLDAKGRDARGAGNAAAAITAQLHAEGSRTVVSVDTDLRISGKIAQFGGGMIREVSEKLLAQFVDCLESKLAVPGGDVPAAQPSTAAGVETTPPIGSPAGSHTFVPAAEAAPADIMRIAGSSIYKRVLPVLAAVLIIVALIVYFVVK